MRDDRGRQRSGIKCELLCNFDTPSDVLAIEDRDTEAAPLALVNRIFKALTRDANFCTADFFWEHIPVGDRNGLRDDIRS